MERERGGLRVASFFSLKTIRHGFRVQIWCGPVRGMGLQVGDGPVAGGNGQDFGADGAGAFDIPFGVADDQDLSWV